jgi:hypothetical protein
MEGISRLAEDVLASQERLLHGVSYLIGWLAGWLVGWSVSQ